MGLIHDLTGFEIIKPHQPVSLVQSVLPHEWRCGNRRQTVVVPVHGDITGVIDPFEGGSLIECRGEREDLSVRVGGGADDQLRALSCRHKPGGGTEFFPVFGAFEHPLLDETHWGKHIGKILLGRQQLQVLLRGYLQVHTHAIGVSPGLGNQLVTGTRDAFHMDVAVETVYFPQELHYTDHLLHGIIGVTHHTRTEKQSFNIVPAIKRNGQLGQLIGGESSTFHIVAAPVGAIGAVVNTMVGEQNLEQGDTTAVGREAVTDAPTLCRPYPTLHITARGAARRTRYVVLGGIGKDAEFLQCFFVHLVE